MSPPEAQNPTIIHASAVARDGRAALILGASGSGKSALALQLMSFGAELVADDRCLLTRRDGVIDISCPAAIAGRIEARGVGLLAASPCRVAWLHIAVDLDTVEPDRLPPLRTLQLMGLDVRCLRRVDQPHFAAAIWQYLLGGRSD